MLGEFYFHDSRLDLVPTEHLAADGIDEAFGAALAAHPGWTAEHVRLLERGIELYWDRYEELASRASYLRPPRLRCIGVIRDAGAVRPYAQILNESTCTLYLDDLNPTTSHPELVAYLLAFGERAAETGELLRVAVHLAPWWFDRTDEECEAFRTATVQSTRPDADLFRAVATALPWLRDLRHRQLRPVRKGGGHREIPETGILVPRAHESAPDQLIAEIQSAANEALRAFIDRHRGSPADALDRLQEWLADTRPSLLVTDARLGLLWDPDGPTDFVRLRERLGRASRDTVASIHTDLSCIDEHTRRFLASVRNPAALPKPDTDAAQDGYSFLHHGRGMIAYNLDEPGIERPFGPGIPYARAMLGARTLHEWGHLAVDAGWVPRTVDARGWSELRQAFEDRLAPVLAGLPKPVQRAVAGDLGRLAGEGSAAAGLVDIFERRLPDFQANVLASRYQSGPEREAYVRQNIRPLVREYPASDLLRMLIRYVYELQYLGFSEIEDRRTYFHEMTWFETDFFDTGILDEATLDDLVSAARALCDAHAVDEAQFFSLPEAP